MNRQDFMKSNDEIDYVAYANYLEFEKKQLIKYLEDKIEKTKKEEKILREHRVPKFYDIGISIGEQYAYQTVLEKVRSGKYD